MDESQPMKLKLPPPPIKICKLPSLDQFNLSVNDFVIILSLFILYFEVFKSTKSTDSIIFEHILSIFIFLVCLLEFIFIPMFSTSTFFILTLMALFDACAGITITISVARRDFKVRM